MIINKLIVLVILASSMAFAHFGIKTVDSVEVPKFLGTWYRISANPVVFEPKCLCARQVLSANPEGNVSVYNSCNKADATGKLVEIRGTAKAIDASATKLSVDFGLPWKGSYWIVALDSQYRYAVVSDSLGFSLYVMSKSPTLSAELYEEAVNAAKLNHVNVSRLVMQPQTVCNYPPES